MQVKAISVTVYTSIILIGFWKVTESYYDQIYSCVGLLKIVQR